MVVLEFGGLLLFEGDVKVVLCVCGEVMMGEFW